MTKEENFATLVSIGWAAITAKGIIRMELLKQRIRRDGQVIYFVRQHTYQLLPRFHLIAFQHAGTEIPHRLKDLNASDGRGIFFMNIVVGNAFST